MRYMLNIYKYIYMFFSEVDDMNRCWEYLPNRKSYRAKTLRNLAKFGVPTYVYFEKLINNLRQF